MAVACYPIPIMSAKGTILGYTMLSTQTIKGCLCWGEERGVSCIRMVGFIHEWVGWLCLDRWRQAQLVIMITVFTEHCSLSIVLHYCSTASHCCQFRHASSPANISNIIEETIGCSVQHSLQDNAAITGACPHCRLLAPQSCHCSENNNLGQNIFWFDQGYALKFGSCKSWSRNWWCFCCNLGSRIYTGTLKY